MVDLTKYNYDKPLEEIQTNDVVNYNGNDEISGIYEMYVDTVKDGVIVAYKFFKTTLPGELERIEITDKIEKFTKLVLKSSLANDPLTISINLCNFTLEKHGLRVGYVQDPKSLEFDPVSDKWGIYGGKLYTKSIF